MQKVF